MKAIRVAAFGGPEVLQLAEISTPVPGPGQVLVRVQAAGINPVETYVRSGAYAKLPPLPYTPGNDGAGVIESVGADVPEVLRPGSRVWLSGSLTGTYAEYAVCEHRHVRLLAQRTTFSQGAALGVPYSTAYRALVQRGGAKAGETVLIHGATGGTGLAAVQIAKMLGMRVLATGGTELGRQVLYAQGAEVFDHYSPAMPEEVLRASGEGVHLIVEMLANANLGRDLTMLAPGGRVVVVGSRGPVEINPRDAMAREADIRGVMLLRATAEELAQAHGVIDAGLESGALDPIVAAEFSIQNAAQAHEAVMSSGHTGKIVLTMGAAGEE